MRGIVMCFFTCLPMIRLYLPSADVTDVLFRADGALPFGMNHAGYKKVAASDRKRATTRCGVNSELQENRGIVKGGGAP
jgi:hypothetical protein